MILFYSYLLLVLINESDFFKKVYHEPLIYVNNYIDRIYILFFLSDKNKHKR